MDANGREEVFYPQISQMTQILNENKHRELIDSERLVVTANKFSFSASSAKSVDNSKNYVTGNLPITVSGMQSRQDSPFFHR